MGSNSGEILIFTNEVQLMDVKGGKYMELETGPEGRTS